MTNWKRISVKLSEEEFKELERLKQKYNISYNKIIRSGLQLYVGLVITKEDLSDTSFFKVIKPLAKDMKDYTKSRKFARKVDSAISKLRKYEQTELDSKAKDLNRRIKIFSKKRKAGRPKKQRI